MLEAAGVSLQVEPELYRETPYVARTYSCEAVATGVCAGNHCVSNSCPLVVTVHAKEAVMPKINRVFEGVTKVSMAAASVLTVLWIWSTFLG